MPSFAASPTAHFGSSLGLSVASTATSPPAFLTAATSFAGVFDPPVLPAEERDGGVGRHGGERRRECLLDVASFQRSTPSAIRKRRPIAKVIAFNASATASGVHASPSNVSTPPLPDSASAMARRRARRSPMRP